MVAVAISREPLVPRLVRGVRTTPRGGRASDCLRIGEAALHSFEDRRYLNPLIKRTRFGVSGGAE